MEPDQTLDSLAAQFAKLNKPNPSASDRKRATQRRRALLRRDVALPGERLFGRPESTAKNVAISGPAAEECRDVRDSKVKYEDAVTSGTKRKRQRSKIGRKDAALGVSAAVLEARKRVEETRRTGTRGEVLAVRTVERWVRKNDPVLAPLRLAKKEKKRERKFARLRDPVVREIDEVAKAERKARKADPAVWDEKKKGRRERERERWDQALVGASRAVEGVEDAVVKGEEYDDLMDFEEVFGVVVR